MNPALLSSILAGLVIAAAPASAQSQGKISGSEFNPAISLVLDGRYTDIDGGDGELELPGFQLGGEAGLPESGFSTGHNELAISANIDDRLYGAVHTAIIHENGETDIELEEAYIETLGLGFGAALKAGRFFSGIGYLNSVHLHAHDFVDSPLVYDAIWGGHLSETGLQLRWVAPTPFYLSLGAELTTGSEYPSGDNEGNNSGRALFVNAGGDIGSGASWQLGASYYRSSFDEREAGGHDHGHGGEASAVENILLDGEVDVAGLDLVVKWAPGGNPRRTSLKLQAEYFVRNEEGYSAFFEEAHSASADYEGEQRGFYVQGVYQFRPAWRVGLRYDRLGADNRIENFVGDGIDEDEYLEESSLGTAGDPERVSAMVDYAPSHFSRIRLQFNRLDNGRDSDIDMIVLQYVVSLGAHGAHRY